VFFFVSDIAIFVLKRDIKLQLTNSCILLLTTILLRPFVREYPGELVPEETFTHPSSWSSSSLYQLLPSTTIHSIVRVQITCLAIFLHNLSTSSFTYLVRYCYQQSSWTWLTRSHTVLLVALPVWLNLWLWFSCTKLHCATLMCRNGSQFTTNFKQQISFIMAALWNRADHCIFILWLLLSSFFFFFLA